MAAFAILFVYTAGLVWYATLPQALIPLEFHLWDKLCHATAFLVMGALTLMAAGFPALSGAQCARRGVWVVLYSLAIGLLIEFWQSYVPGRQSERADVMADLAGAALAVLLAMMFIRRRERLKNAAHS